MAMLMTNEVFARTWGERAGPAPQDEYWPALIGAHEGGAPGLPVPRRGLLGHGVDAAAAGLRPLLRQAPVRPAGPRVRRGGARAPPGRLRLPGASAAVHREPRRAARRGDLRIRAGEGRRGRHVHPAGRAPLPRRPARGPAHADPGLPGPRTRRAAGRRSALVLRTTAACRRGLRPARRRVAPVRLRGLARQRLPSPAGLLVLAHRGRTPPRRRQPLRRPGAGARAPAVGRSRGTHLAADRPAGRASVSIAPATRSPPTACTSRSTRGRRTSSR